jgi:hypothetical protein
LLPQHAQPIVPGRLLPQVASMSGFTSDFSIDSASEIFHVCHV